MGRYAICAGHSSALIFFWNGTQWTQQAILTEDPSATQNRKYFGSAVAMGADFAVASNNIRQHISVDLQNSSTGTVYVYKRDGSNWSLWVTITGERNGQAVNIGESLAISESYILVAVQSHPRFRYNEAAVYLYEVQDKQIIHHGRVSVASSRTPDKKMPKKLEGFGCAVAMHDRNIVVGAMRANDVDDQGRKAYEGGAAYLFEWN